MTVFSARNIRAAICLLVKPSPSRLSRTLSCSVRPESGSVRSAAPRSLAISAAAARLSSSDRPAPTSLMAWASSMPLMSLTTYPLAPARMASSIASSEVNDVSIRQRNSGIFDSRSRHSSMPLPSGRRTSRTATSGFSTGICAIAWTTDPASPITSRSGSVPNRSIRPRRTTSWSSTRKTVTLDEPMASHDNAVSQQPLPVDDKHRTVGVLQGGLAGRTE